MIMRRLFFFNECVELLGKSGIRTDQQQPQDIALGVTRKHFECAAAGYFACGIHEAGYGLLVQVQAYGFQYVEHAFPLCLNSFDSSMTATFWLHHQAVNGCQFITKKTLMK